MGTLLRKSVHILFKVYRNQSKMKKLILAIISFLFGISTTQSQNSNHIEWRFTVKKISPNTFNIHMTALISQPWHIYTKLLNIPDSELCSITFNHSAFIILANDIQVAGVPIQGFDLAIKEEARYFKTAVNFIQKVTLIVDEPVTLNGIIEYVIGDGIDKLETHKKEFNITINE